MPVRRSSASAGADARRQQQRFDLAAHAFPRDAAQRSARFVHGGLDLRVGFQSERSADARRAQRAQRILSEALARGADGAQSSRCEILRATPGIDDRAARGVPGDRVHGEVAVREVVAQRRTGAEGGDVEWAGARGQHHGAVADPGRNGPREEREHHFGRRRSRDVEVADCDAAQQVSNAAADQPCLVSGVAQDLQRLAHGQGNGFGAKRTRHRAQSTRAIAQEPG